MAASNAVWFVVAVIVVLALVFVAWSSINTAAGKSNIAILLTDPPNVPSGTQQLLVSYSSVQVHVSGDGNQSGWVSATGSGTLNLLAVINSSETIANAQVASNSVINLIRFNITSVKIVINGTSYNVSSPNNQVNVAITGNSKVNSSSAVLIDFYPTVNAHGSGTSATYVMAPAARGIIVNGSSNISINANIGSIVSVGAGIKARLGLGSGEGGGSNSGSESTVVVHSGQRISNFMVQGINYSAGSVAGLLYTQYPVASDVGVNATMHVGGTIGYACDNTKFTLTSVNANNTATFTFAGRTSTPGGCPI